MAAKLYFIFCTLYNLHKFKMAANMLNTDYYNFSVHASLHAYTITFGIRDTDISHISVTSQSRLSTNR